MITDQRIREIYEDNKAGAPTGHIFSMAIIERLLIAERVIANRLQESMIAEHKQDAEAELRAEGVIRDDK